jgi:hypothetical protein
MRKAKAAHLLDALTIKNNRCPANKIEIRLQDGGGLFVRIRRDGTKTFLFRYDGRSRTLGRWPQMELAQARKLAAELRPVRRGTSNPIEEAREREQRAKEEAESKRRREAAAGMTGDDLFERFVQLHGSAHWTAKTMRNKRNLWRLHAGGVGVLKASDVRREHLTQACDKLLKARKYDTANELHKLARQVFAWAVDRDLLENNALAAAKRKPAPKAAPKTHALSFDELRMLLARNRSAPLAKTEV